MLTIAGMVIVVGLMICFAVLLYCCVRMGAVADRKMREWFENKH